MTREESIQQWSEWVRQDIGGPAERVDAATRAAVYALDSGGQSDAIVNAAQTAAAIWDANRSQQQAYAQQQAFQQQQAYLQQQAHLQRRSAKPQGAKRLVLLIMVFGATFMLLHELRNPIVVKQEGILLIILGIFGFVSLFALIGSFRR